jgi:hypothetical protein
VKQLHQGWDYRLYKVYIWGGLALVVGFIVVSTLVLDGLNLPGPQRVLLLFGPIVLWFGGVLLYWWWVFLFKGNRDLEALSQAQEPGVPGIKALKSWNTLHQAMAIHGGDVEALIKNEKKANRPVLLWYGSLNLLALWIFGPIALGSLEIFQMDAGIWIAGVVVWVLLMLVGTPVLLSWGAKRAENAYLAPLGLALTRMPRLKVDAIGLFGGGQKLIPDGPAVVEGAPEVVFKALRSLRKAKRWRGIVVDAGPGGIGIQRQSKGTNMWLYDLWLAEYLLDKIEAS